MGLANAQAEDRRWDLAFVGILLYLIAEYTRVEAMYPVIAPIHIGKVVIGLSALGLVTSSVLRGPRAPGRALVDASIIGFLIANFLSACFAHYEEIAWNGFWVSLTWVVVYFLVSRIVTSAWRLRVFVLVYLILNLKLAQFAVRTFLLLRSTHNAMVVATIGAGAGSTDFFGNAADLGVAMCVVWPLALCLVFTKPKGLQRLFLLASCAAFLLAILVCGSRGAVVGACAVALAGWARSPRKLAALLMLVLLLPGIYFILPSATKQRMESAEHPLQDPTASSRIRFWKAGLQMFEDHPLLGVGPANFPRLYAAQYAGKEDWGLTPTQHSTYVQTISELGVAGALPVLSLWVLLPILNGRSRKRLVALDPAQKQSFEYWLAVGLDLGLVGYLVSGAFVSVLEYPHLWILLGLSAGLSTVCARKQQERISSEPLGAGPELVPAEV